MKNKHVVGRSDLNYNLLLLFIIFIIAPSTLFSQVNAIWALGDEEKVFKDDLNHSSKAKNLTWDGNIIKLKGFYNEVLAFQVIVESGSKGVEEIDITVENPINSKFNKIIGGNTLKYGPSGTIEIYTQHYLYVPENRTSPPSWFYGSPASAPEKMSGWIPDALINKEAKRFSSGPTDRLDPGEFGKPTQFQKEMGGLPINIEPLQNQGFWVDIHLPRDRKNFPDGVYIGSVQVLEKGNLIKQIPLEITLLPEYLPDENKTNIWLFTSDVNSYFPGSTREEVDKMLKFEGHRHRIDIVGGFDANRSKFNEDIMKEYKPWLDGNAYTPSNGYWGPGISFGERYFPIGMYGAKILGDTKEEVQRESDLWVSWFKNNAPEAVYMWYIVDEPPVTLFPWIKERSNWIKSNTGVGKELPIFTTRGYTKELDGYIDIWSAYNGVNMEDLSAARKNGGDYFFYNGLRPHNGTTILEGEAVDFRINSWLLYKYGINCHFIWHGTHWRHNWQGPKGNLHQNVFQSPITFSEFGNNDYGNGAGTLFYPGRMPYYPEEDRGLNVLFPSIRLKNIRRGQQDASIMWLAEQKAGKKAVLDLINEVIPKAFNEVGKEDPVAWSENGDDYNRVREKLIELIIK